MTPERNGGNVYLAEIGHVLPRILAAFDRDPLSPTLGVGDRIHWAWKTQDFPNATPQGAVHGLARLAASGLLPPGVSKPSVMGRIDEIIAGTARITARDGSLDEAFPNEKSFCVTALVAFDILKAAELQAGEIDQATRARWLETAAPLIEFIVRHDETHEIISNHLATAVAALTLWTGAGASHARQRARQLLDIILANQSADGWYAEYGGADPGYETLGLYYLADVHFRQPELGLAESLERSLGFLSHFVHPDGSFGGLYGTRNTRFLVPAGIEALAGSFPMAASLARFARRAIANRTLVTLAALDEPNLAPNFNAYCWAAQLAASAPLPDGPALPCETREPWRRHFAQARIVVDNGLEHYTIAAPAKGGVVAHFSKTGGGGVVDAGVAGTWRGRFCTTQAFQPANPYVIDGDVLRVSAPFVETVSERPTATKFLVLRLLAVSVFRWRGVTEVVKRMLVRRLITGQKRAPGINTREIRFGPDLRISDTQSAGCEVSVARQPRAFSAIHMASAGYWQRQDDES